MMLSSYARLLAALSTLLIPLVLAGPCKEYPYGLSADPHPMDVTYEFRNHLSDGSVTITQTWHYIQTWLPNYNEIRVETYTEPNPLSVTVYLFDTGPEPQYRIRHNTVFQLVRKNLNMDAYTVNGTDTTCNFQYSGEGSDITHVRVFHVN